MKLITNPPNPFVSEYRELLEPAQQVKVEIYEEDTKDILSHNTSPDLPFRWSVNPYRGCFHGCTYCYARPSHEYWGFGAGTDFESKLIVKSNAADRLRHAFLKPSWKGELIVFSGNTDCYQPIEATYQLTRQCLEVCREFRNPVGIITKSALIQRDIDVLLELHQQAWIAVYLSIPFNNNDTARKVEPHAPSITKRFETLEKLSQVGIATGVSIAPVIPGLNEQDIPNILHRARLAGATAATFILLRLPGNVEPVFLQSIGHAFPDRLKKITNRIRDVRDGTMTDNTFFTRHTGQGHSWHTIQQLFEMSYKKEGFPQEPDPPIPHTFQRPGPTQTSLF